MNAVGAKPRGNKSPRNATSKPIKTQKSPKQNNETAKSSKRKAEARDDADFKKRPKTDDSMRENKFQQSPRFNRGGRQNRPYERSPRRNSQQWNNFRSPKPRFNPNSPYKSNGSTHWRNSSEADNRTIFVSNVPTTTLKKELINFFSKYGEIESVRFRGATFINKKIPRKVAYILKQFDPRITTQYCYVVYKDAVSANSALEANGKVFKDHHIFVDLGFNSKQWDANKAIFIGNIPYNANEEDLWKAFSDIGRINSVRLILDKETGLRNGTGHVNFCSSDSVELALQKNDFQIHDKELRVFRHKGTYNNEGVDRRSKSQNDEDDEENDDEEESGEEEENVNDEESGDDEEVDDEEVDSEDEEVDEEEVDDEDEEVENEANDDDIEGQNDVDDEQSENDEDENDDDEGANEDEPEESSEEEKPPKKIIQKTKKGKQPKQNFTGVKATVIKKKTKVNKTNLKKKKISGMLNVKRKEVYKSI